MKLIRRAWQYTLGDPLSWLFRYLTKADDFFLTFDMQSTTIRFQLLLRLIPSMFFLTYPISVLLVLTFSQFHFNWVYTLFATGIGTLVGVITGIAWDRLANIPVAFQGSMWLGIWLGTWSGVSWHEAICILLITTGGIILGIGSMKDIDKTTIKSWPESKKWGSYMKQWFKQQLVAQRHENHAHLTGDRPLTNIPASNIKHLETPINDISRNTLVWSQMNDRKWPRPIETLEYGIKLLEYGIGGLIGMCLLLLNRCYLMGGLTSPIEVDSRCYLIGGGVKPPISIKRISTIILRWAIGTVIIYIIASILTSLISGSNLIWQVCLAATMGSLVGILAGIMLKQARNTTVDFAGGVGSGVIISTMLRDMPLPVTFHVTISLALALVATITWGISTYMGISCFEKTRRVNPMLLLAGLAVGILAGQLSNNPIKLVILFFVCYVVSCWQLPHWIIIVIATISHLTKLKSLDTFTFLYGSALYWDVWTVFPLLGLGWIMRKAIQEDLVQALKIFAFIEAERPQQIGAVRQGLRIIHEEMRKQRKVAETFTYLRNSSFYWEETLALDNLAVIIQIGSVTDKKQTQEMVDFIKLQRPQWTEEAYTGLKVTLQSLIQKANIFEISAYLHDFSLDWDEQDISPQVLARKIEQGCYSDPQRTLEIVSFIGKEKPDLVEAAYVGLQNGLQTNIAEELKKCETMRDISEAIQQITQLLSREIMQTFPDIIKLLTTLKEVCLNARYYRNSLGWKAREEALQTMIQNLQNIRKDNKITSSLLVLVTNWESTSQHELNKLKQEEPRKTDLITNPYIVGSVLQAGTSLFVGRLDLVQQLERGLKQESHRPTFFLNGERRMGKSSTLKQLPFRLDGQHFLPLFFDLQAPEMTSSITAFLGTIAEKIEEGLASIGIPLKERLARDHLQEAREKNEHQPYDVFNEWLKKVERTLKLNEYIVLLSFDEFEHVENVGEKNVLDLHLLLSWFRSVIQNRPQLAILFSGGKSVSEMGQKTGENWSSYFVNVQTFRVGILRESEARQLITQPTPDYPIARIFGDGVVDEIIRVTGSHPFLVQAVCSHLVDILNADNREQAHMKDVEAAVMQVLENWEDYFQDLWKRSDMEQRTCLTILNGLGKAKIQQIEQKMYADQSTVHTMSQTVGHTLNSLLRRDLVLSDNEYYQLATPIFKQWIERNSALESLDVNLEKGRTRTIQVINQLECFNPETEPISKDAAESREDNLPPYATSPTPMELISTDEFPDLLISPLSPVYSDFSRLLPCGHEKRPNAHFCSICGTEIIS